MKGKVRRLEKLAEQGNTEAKAELSRRAAANVRNVADIRPRASVPPLEAGKRKMLHEHYTGYRANAQLRSIHKKYVNDGKE